MQSAYRSALVARQQDGPRLRDKTGPAGAVDSEGNSAAGCEFASHLQQPGDGAARTRSTHRVVAELFDHTRDQLAVEAATDQHGDIAITISVAGRKKTLMPESVK